MYDRILVPLKGDLTDEAVVAHTGSLAQMSGGRVTLLRVVHSHSRDEAAFGEEQARRYLDALTGQLSAAGVDADGRVASGEPASTIVSVAREMEADLIIMATHGHREVRHVFVGSVTEDVVRSGVTPVLLVRP
jgi:nucleotide-binding universal stress UspA family protein